MSCTGVVQKLQLSSCLCGDEPTASVDKFGSTLLPVLPQILSPIKISTLRLLLHNSVTLRALYRVPPEPARASPLAQI